MVRSYPGHAGQISSLSFRPLNRGESLSRSQTPERPAVAISLRPGAEEDTSKQDDAPAGPSTTQKQPEESDKVAMQEAIEQPTPPIQETEKEVHQPTGTPSAQTHSDKDSGRDDAAQELAFQAELEKSLGLDNGAGDPFGKTAEASLRNGSVDAGPAKSRRSSKIDSEGDNDSLFGDGSEDAAADADMDADADADADAEGEEDDDDGDGEAEDDDQPLARMTKPSETKAGGAGVSLPGLAGGVSTPSGSTLPLPQAGSTGGSVTETSKGVGAATKTFDAATAVTANGKTSRLSRPALPGLTTTEGFDGDYTQFSNDVFLSTTLGGQAILWDRRIPASSTSPRGVRALPLPEKTPPWCASATWAPDGERIYIGRRNEAVEEWDMRMLSGDDGMSGAAIDAFSSMSYSWAPPRRRTNPALRRTLRFPSSSGPVTSLTFMPNGKHLVCASYDNVRLWNLSLDTTASSSTSASSSAIPFRIVAGHHGGMISSMAVDATGRFLFSASGDRGWISGSTETILISEITGSI